MPKFTLLSFVTCELRPGWGKEFKVVQSSGSFLCPISDVSPGASWWYLQQTTKGEQWTFTFVVASPKTKGTKEAAGIQKEKVQCPELSTFVLPYASWTTKLNFQVQRSLGNVVKWYYHKNLLVVYKATITKKVGSIQTKKIECIQSMHQLRSIQYKRLFRSVCIQSKHTEQAYNRCFCLIEIGWLKSPNLSQLISA